MNKNNKNILSFFKNATAGDWQDWRWQFKNRFTKAEQLDHFPGKSLLQTKYLNAVTAVYPMAVTPYYLSLFQLDDENDPIRAQCIPDLREISCYKD